MTASPQSPRPYATQDHDCAATIFSRNRGADAEPSSPTDFLERAFEGLPDRFGLGVRGRLDGEGVTCQANCGPKGPPPFR
jgi:hypothetical protein